MSFSPKEGMICVTRGGQKVGPLQRGEQFETGPWKFKFEGNYYDAEGGSFVGPSSCGLIGEWADISSPVRRVTRIEIVTGPCGPINVTSVYPDGVNIYANSGKWNAADLRHAARSFVSMAEVLEDR